MPGRSPNIPLNPSSHAARTSSCNSTSSESLLSQQRASRTASNGSKLWLYSAPIPAVLARYGKREGRCTACSACKQSRRPRRQQCVSTGRCFLAILKSCIAQQLLNFLIGNELFPDLKVRRMGSRLFRVRHHCTMAIVSIGSRRMYDAKC